MRRARPLWDGGGVITKGSIIHLVNKDMEEGSCLFILVWLELRMDLDDEGRSHSRE